MGLSRTGKYLYYLLGFSYDERMQERLYWLGFSVCWGIGPAKFALLLDYFKSAKNAWKASESDLQASGLGEVLTQKFKHFRKTFSLEHYAEKLEQKKVSYLTLLDTHYPHRLKQIPKAPFVLFVKGDVSVFNTENQTYVGVVGTRKVTQYGREVTTILTQELVENSCTIVSGLAMGVDSIAHTTTIQGNGTTIAVLGSGVDMCTPVTNQHICNSILESGGAIVSEFLPGQLPTVGSFPVRNRIIAGLSDGVLVTQGAEDSGALITARHAFEFGRPVFAVPGPITSGLSKGPYKLIEQGAKLITSGGDIVKELGIKNYELRIEKKELKGETVEEQMILDLLVNESLSMDQIVRQTKMSSAVVGSLVTLMELKGMVKNTPIGFSLSS